MLLANAAWQLSFAIINLYAMEKIYLQFKNRREILLFSEQLGSPHCMIDWKKLVLICELTEKEIEIVQAKYGTNIINQDPAKG